MTFDPEDRFSQPPISGIVRCLQWEFNRGRTPEQLRESAILKISALGASSGISHSDADEMVARISGTRTAFDYKAELPDFLIPKKGEDFIGNYIDHGLKVAKRPVAPFYLGGGLALVSALIGRRVRTETDGRPNIMIICSGFSGSGKDGPRQLNKRLAHSSGADDRLAPESIFSGSGIVSALSAKLSALFQFDEIGRLLRANSGKGADPHGQGIKTKLLTLYSSSGTIYQPDGYVDEKRNIVLNQPNCVLYGSTVPESLFEGLTKEGMSDGFISRLLIIESKEIPAMQFAPVLELPKSCIDFASAWNSWAGHGEIPQAWESMEPTIIPFSDSARELIKDYYRECDLKAGKKDEDDGSSLWRRAAEKAEKLALIRSCSHHMPSERFAIEEAHMQWGIDLTSWLTQKLLVTAGDWIAENSQEALVNKVYRVVQAAGRKGIIKRNLTRKTQFIRERDRHEILTTLIESGRVTATKSGESITYTAA